MNVFMWLKNLKLFMVVLTGILLYACLEKLWRKSYVCRVISAVFSTIVVVFLYSASFGLFQSGKDGEKQVLPISNSIIETYPKETLSLSKDTIYVRFVKSKYNSNIAKKFCCEILTKNKKIENSSNKRQEFEKNIIDVIKSIMSQEKIKTIELKIDPFPGDAAIEFFKEIAKQQSIKIKLQKRKSK